MANNSNKSAIALLLQLLVIFAVCALVATFLSSLISALCLSRGIDPKTKMIYLKSMQTFLELSIFMIPALIFAYKNSQNINNYWGIKIYNGMPCSTGGIYGSLEEGIVAYANTLKKYNPGGEKASQIKDTYEARSKAGCDSAGHGLPGTLEGMQSVYSWIGDYRYNPGDWNIGGCKYFNGYIYASDYCSNVPTCEVYGYNSSTKTVWANCSADSKTTVCEQNDYTAFQLKQKISLRYDIFGL